MLARTSLIAAATAALSLACGGATSKRDCGCEDAMPDLHALEAGTPVDDADALPLESPLLESPQRTRDAPPIFAVSSEVARLRVLGIAQDGGLPHIGCDCVRCNAARALPELRASTVASVALIAPGHAGAGVWIVDATPDLPAQLDALTDVRELVVGGVDRSPLSGIFLTHAHMGHYIGLAHLGFEAASSAKLPVHASARMIEFLTTNAPWDQLVRFENIAPALAQPGVVLELGAGLRAEPLLVPHRGEYTDTLAWYLSGPNKRALYIPDTDPWATWTASLDTVLEGVDLLLVDGTFYSGDELPGRDTSKIGHPLMSDTMDRFEDRLGADFELWFIHLNHSNPTLDPAAPERLALERRGFRVAAAGDEYAL